MTFAPLATPFLSSLTSAAGSGAPTITDGVRSLGNGELDAAIDARVADLASAGLADRSVVLLAGANSIEWVVTYLALMQARHVPLLASDHVDRLVDRWAPGAVVRADDQDWSLDVRDRSPRDLHPDLALLMSTSGSTGNPKLVRLSAANLAANAASIAEFQRLGAADVGITSLPLHYSFGLSVLHSHLAVGATVVVTDRSIVDPCFHRLLVDGGVTNIAGVPHTYEMLDRIGPEHARVPTLRFLAQAGGRMAPDRVSAWAERARTWGVEWFSMYGQTEATARISYVPPTAVRSHPDSIGIAIPGGSLSIEAVDAIADSEPGDGVGEIVYRGPNVMMGYAHEPPDLALDGGLDELHTGDLGRRDPETGFVHVVGRLARRVKPFGLRIDLDDVERRLADRGIAATVAGDDELVVASAPDAVPADVVAAIADATGLPAARVVALHAEPPRTSNGKVDAPAMLRDARLERASVDESDSEHDRIDAVCAAYATVLGLERVEPGATFVSLGGDSLSYVECSIRLEQIVGTLPPDWHLRPIGDLAAAPRRRLARVDTSVVLRAIGILAVVSTHMRLRHVPGGAHLMLAVVGYNLARFMMPAADARSRLRAGLRTVGRVAVPTVLWTAALMLLGQYTWSTLTLMNNYIGPRSHAGNHWHFWFIEVFTHLVLVTTLLYAIPAVRRADVRWPYAFPLALLAATLTLRMEWADMGDWYNLRFRTHAVAWFFVLGWLVQRSSTWQQKVATTVLCLATAPGVFQNPRREYFIALGLVLLVWVKEIPLPRPSVRPVATIAAASMWIFISHFMIWPPMKDWFVVEVAYPLTILASLGVWWAVTRAPRRLADRLAGRFAVGRRIGRIPIQFTPRPPNRVAPTPL